MLRILRRFLIEAKMLIGRSANYVSIANSGMIVFLFFSNLKDKGYIDWDLGSKLWIIYFGGMAALIAFGALEVYLFKGYQAEQVRSLELNPYWMEMRNDIKEIKEKLK